MTHRDLSGACGVAWIGLSSMSACVVVTLDGKVHDPDQPLLCADDLAAVPRNQDEAAHPRVLFHGPPQACLRLLGQAVHLVEDHGLRRGTGVSEASGWVLRSLGVVDKLRRLLRPSPSILSP